MLALSQFRGGAFFLETAMNNENLKPVKKGEIRNPKGRPKNSKNFKTIYKKILQQKFKKAELEEILGSGIPFISKDEKVTIQYAIVLRHIQKTLEKCDHLDIKLIKDTVDGMVTQKMKTTGKLELTEKDTKIIVDEIFKNKKE
jgi:hypothetical protein